MQVIIYTDYFWIGAGSCNNSAGGAVGVTTVSTYDENGNSIGSFSGNFLLPSDFTGAPC
jgi:hypothetical protein